MSIDEYFATLSENETKVDAVDRFDYICTILWCLNFSNPGLTFILRSIMVVWVIVYSKGINMIIFVNKHDRLPAATNKLWWLNHAWVNEIFPVITNNFCAQVQLAAKHGCWPWLTDLDCGSFTVRNLNIFLFITSNLWELKKNG